MSVIRRHTGQGGEPLAAGLHTQGRTRPGQSIQAWEQLREFDATENCDPRRTLLAMNPVRADGSKQFAAFALYGRFPVTVEHTSATSSSRDRQWKEKRKEIRVSLFA